MKWETGMEKVKVNRRWKLNREKRNGVSLSTKCILCESVKKGREKNEIGAWDERDNMNRR